MSNLKENVNVNVDKLTVLIGLAIFFNIIYFCKSQLVLKCLTIKKRKEPLDKKTF